MKLRQLELRRLSLDLITPFRTSHGVETVREALILRVGTDVGDGWSECVAMANPTYTSEFVDGAELVIARHLWPALTAPDDVHASTVAHLLAHVVGHQMAKAAVEAAVLDAELRAADICLHTYLGATRDRVPSGVSVGMFDTLDELLAQVQAYVDDGYARIKLKIQPGWDVEPVRLVRELIGPDMGLQADANSAYQRTDAAHLALLDEFDLLLVEQPLALDDLVGHAALADAIDTPVCLDESIVSLQTAADAIELGAAEVINLKPGRVGGYLEARRIHDLCLDRGVPLWCGGMLETGIGRAANAALAALPGFTLPGDISGSSRFYAHDIVHQPLELDNGHIAVPVHAGMGFELDHDAVERATTSVTTLTGR